MNENYQDLLEQAFADPNVLAPDKVRGLVDETMRLFEEIRHKFASQDPQEREEAVRLSLEMKGALEKQMERISKVTGIDPAQFAALPENQRGIPKEDAELVAEVRRKLQTFQKDAEVKTVRKKKAPKIKLMG